MNFVDEEMDLPKNNKKRNLNKPTLVASILLIAIFIVIILIVVISSSISKMKNNELTLSLDGVDNKKLKEMLITEENGTMYFPIRETAEFLGYKSYNGNYFNKSENTEECYIESKDEIVTFVNGAEEIEKLTPTDNTTTSYAISHPIKRNGDQLYISMDGFEKIYNLKYDYDKKNNKIVLKTMSYIIEKNKEKILEKRL